MAVGPVYPFTPPSPHNAALVNGELTLSVATPLNSAAANTTFRLSRWFDFEGGIYMIRSVSDDVSTWMSSISLNNGKVLFSSAVGNGVVDRTVFIPRGRKRLDIILVNTSSSASACYVAFSLWQFGRLVYASDAPGWVCDTAAIPDASVPLPAARELSFPLFPLAPNWAGGVTERIEFTTEIMDSESDAEQRRSLRRYPRRSIEASFLRQGVSRSRLDAFLLGIGKNELLLPLWHEQEPITSTLGSTYTFATGTRVLREFQVGGLAVAYLGPQQYELLTISSASGDTITFSAVPVQSWPAGTRLIPVRVARLMDAARFENQTDNVATLQARFDLIEPETWPVASWGNASRLFNFIPDWSTAISIDFDRKVFTLDTQTGPMDVLDVGDRARVGMRMALRLFGRAKVVALKAFFMQARGRTVRFWIPDFMQSVHLHANIAAGTSIDAKPAGFAENVKSPQDARSMLAIVFKDGSPTLYRTLLNVSDEGSFERFTVGSALPAIAMSAVEKIEFMLPARFDQDGFELHHNVDQSAAVQTTLVVRSAEKAGMPSLT